MLHKSISILQSPLKESEQFHWHDFRVGSDEDYEKLYNAYVDDLYRYGYMLVRNQSLVEDAIHDVFTDIWKSEINVSKIASIRLYLFSSVKRRLLRKIRKERTFLHFQDDQQAFPFDVIPSFLDTQIDIADRNILSKKLKEGLDNLSNRQREIIYLRFYQNITYTQIAELLELDQKYIYNLASKAFCALRSKIPNSING